ncbi:hypothetical protein MUK42_29361 [Musa troglodytarum]|uniref:Uncharacterized protein n=1 Tax=Musa troglodytarum TaxID=320322 RepID=A0A9E7FCY9_9LILI|nr:hypothetical protein MUK42_29361 [Musa troglodytarum]
MIIGKDAVTLWSASVLLLTAVRRDGHTPAVGLAQALRRWWFGWWGFTFLAATSAIKRSSKQDEEWLVAASRGFFTFLAVTSAIKRSSKQDEEWMVAATRRRRAARRRRGGCGGDPPDEGGEQRSPPDGTRT